MIKTVEINKTEILRAAREEKLSMPQAAMKVLKDKGAPIIKEGEELRTCPRYVWASSDLGKEIHVHYSPNV